jgi:hypothetical protein
MLINFIGVAALTNFFWPEEKFVEQESLAGTINTNR